MAFTGAGFYAMWNGMDPAYLPEFDLMHARSHMSAHVAYLGEGAILAARRHVGGVGTLPPFFTFYDMRSLDVLTAPEYRDLRVNESPWFLRLRPHYRDHVRHHCHVVGRAGGGVGGSVGTLLMRLTQEAARDPGMTGDFCSALVERAPVTAAHLGIADPAVPTLVGGSPPPRNPDDEPVGVLLVEGYDRYALSSELPAIIQHVVDRGIAAAPPRWGHYALSMALEYGELGVLHPLNDAPG